MSSEREPDEFADVRTHVPCLARHPGWARLLESFLGYPKIRQAFSESAEEANPFAATAQKLGLSIRVEGLAEKIPSEGPVVVLANHGHGGADALALMAAMCDLRDDFRTLANREVTLLAGVARNIIPVSLLDPESRGSNPAGLRATLKHVRNGGALGVFPAGRVAYWQGDRMKDPPWNPHIIKLLQRMDTPVVPLWFFGRPPALIPVLSKLSGFVRTALIPTGPARMKGREIVARAGEPIDSSRLKDLGAEAGPWLRKKLEGIAELGN